MEAKRIRVTLEISFPDSFSHLACYFSTINQNIACECGAYHYLGNGLGWENTILKQLDHPRSCDTCGTKLDAQALSIAAWEKYRHGINCTNIEEIEST